VTGVFGNQRTSLRYGTLNLHTGVSTAFANSTSLLNVGHNKRPFVFAQVSHKSQPVHQCFIGIFHFVS
jgi:hypothetical protein